MISVSPRRMTCFMRRPPRPSRPFPADRGLDEARDESVAQGVPVALVLDDHFVRRIPRRAVDVEGRELPLAEVLDELSVPLILLLFFTRPVLVRALALVSLADRG